ncbi:hypothetical protein RE428_00600 [Marinobacter nanhaiticus D15-8W]|uniref:hypothetical protein n=1 Tax=Marinobacter nanhaiticus TaxID=1305740 RepID=UPI0012B642E6|nr:hypothetical protein [Marinobacter nanhaiticus]BES69042.1 hypothetical protein RE428_00600 [Marinobacter nanhaiticus D15-8W]
MFKWIVAALAGIVVGNWLLREEGQSVRRYEGANPPGRPGATGNQAGVQPGTPHPGVNKPV